MDGRRLPQSTIEMEEGSCKFAIQLWWGIPPRVGKLNGFKVPTKHAETEVKDEFRDVPCETERVTRGDKQRYKDISKDFKVASVFGECSHRRYAKRPIIYADGLGDPNPITKVGCGLNGPIRVDGMTDGEGLSGGGFTSFGRTFFGRGPRS